MTEEKHQPESISPSLRMETVPYQPDGGYGPGGTAVLLGAVMIAGFLMGWIASWIGQYFHLVIVFPIAIGAVLGLVSAFFVDLGKVRSPLVGGVAGFFGGCVAMTAMQYFDYQRFRTTVEEQREAILADQKALDKLLDAGQDAMIAGEEAKKLQQAIADHKLAMMALKVSNFFEYIDFSARQGVTIGRIGRGDGLNLGYYGTYIYWLVEILIVAFLAYGISRGAASNPFCRMCQQWKENRNLGGFLTPEIQRVQSAIQNGELGNLLQFERSREGGDLLVTAAVCPSCGPESPIDVTLAHHSVNKKGEVTTQELAHVTYPGEALAVFEALFAHDQTPGEEQSGSQD